MCTDYCHRVVTQLQLINISYQNAFQKSCRLGDNVENAVERGKAQVTTWRTCISYWMPTATNTHSEYVILIDFPLQQWLHESVSMLIYRYIACLVAYDSGSCYPRRHSSHMPDACSVQRSRWGVSHARRADRLSPASSWHVSPHTELILIMGMCPGAVRRIF
jgi:hypothetical protein